MIEKSIAEHREATVKVSWVAYKEAPAEIKQQAEACLKQIMPADSYEITESDPDIVLFMSGGSERKAITLINPGHPVLLLSISGKNAYASATEVMAWLKDNRCQAILSDAQEASETGLITGWVQAVKAWESLRGRKTGLIGSVAEWLVTADETAALFEKATGINLVQILWDVIPDYSSMKPDEDLSSRFKGTGALGLDDAARVLTILRDVVADYNLDAVAVECFSLVRKRAVTACLALAQLNTEGFVAACEGDLVSLAGMMTVKAATGIVPWMANTTRIAGNTLILSHCTVAFNLVEDISLATHFETDCSLAVKSLVPATEVTLFRYSGKLDKAFIAEGRVTGNPAMSDACRTQAAIELPDEAVTLLHRHPLGNHLLMVPGRYSALLRLMCLLRNIDVTG